MSLYKPTVVPQIKDETLRTYLAQELARIQRCMAEADDKLKLNYLYAAPTKYDAGDIVLADGTSWNPGSGEGAYRRNKANSAWVFLG